ncbi:MAG: hypothetical protein ABIJ74_04560 [archaeon]
MIKVKIGQTNDFRSRFATLGAKRTKIANLAEPKALNTSYGAIYYSDVLIRSHFYLVLLSFIFRNMKNNTFDLIKKVDFDGD